MNYVDVSVLITCFNKEQYLSECIDSVLRQTKQPREIIVVHDGCENPQHHVAVDTLILRTNSGVSFARNKAFSNSKGKLILFVDADDCLSPDFLEKMVLTIYDGADIAYSDTYFWQSTENSMVILPDTIDAKFVYEKRKPVLTVSSLMKREVFEQLNGFLELPIFEDVDFFLRAIAEGFVLKKAHTLLWYRQMTGTRNRIDYIKKKDLLNDVLSKFVITEEKITYNYDKKI